MTSKPSRAEVFVWIWLPGTTEPVVAGRLNREGGNIRFNYGRSYLGRKKAIAIYDPELPLEPGLLPLPKGLSMPSAIRDASPDAWGRRVIVNRLLGVEGAAADGTELDELTFLLESGSDRIGALDFQMSATRYEPRLGPETSLEELLASAERVEKGLPLSPDLDLALRHGTALGGARPKVLIDATDRKYIAKFSASNDLTNVVKGEYVAMRLAAIAGLRVAPVRLERAAGKDVLMVERFDRRAAGDGWERRALVSALTLLELDEMMARYASYETLAEIVRHRFIDPAASLRELFGRLIFNILSGNTDDHARNHAAFWDGHSLELTPAYDVCPQIRTGGEASQAMKIVGDVGASQLRHCLDVAAHFRLSRGEAAAIVAHQVGIIKSHWDRVCDEAAMAPADRDILRKGAFLKPYAFENLPPELAAFSAE